MINPYNFTNRTLQVGFEVSIDSHHNNHANSELTYKPNFPEIAIETRYVSKIMKELSVIYAILINQYKFRYQTVFSARFDKQDEYDQVLDETEIIFNLNDNQNLTESDLDNIDVKCPLEHQTQQHEMNNSGWRFDRINSMILFFYKSDELNGSNYFKTLLR